MNGVGRHLIKDFYGCNPTRIADLDFMERLATEAAERSGATFLYDGNEQKKLRNRNTHGGCYVLIPLAESHIAVSTYPDANYVLVDVFTCGERLDPEKAVEYMQGILSPKHQSGYDLVRGEGVNNPV